MGHCVSQFWSCTCPSWRLFAAARRRWAQCDLGSIVEIDLDERATVGVGRCRSANAAPTRLGRPGISGSIASVGKILKRDLRESPRIASVPNEV
jgi:hypothetical protein